MVKLRIIITCFPDGNLFYFNLNNLSFLTISLHSSNVSHTATYLSLHRHSYTSDLHSSLTIQYFTQFLHTFTHSSLHSSFLQLFRPARSLTLTHSQTPFFHSCTHSSLTLLFIHCLTLPSSFLFIIISHLAYTPHSYSAQLSTQLNTASFFFLSTDAAPPTTKLWSIESDIFRAQSILIIQDK